MVTPARAPARTARRCSPSRKETHDGTSELQQRWSGSLMNNYGVPQAGARRAVTARSSPTPTASSTWICSAASPSTSSATASGDRRGRHSSAGHARPRVQPVRHRAGRRTGRTTPRAPSAHGTGRAFFCNSGTEANEAAFKIARLTGRPKIIAAEKAFHGRTMGALALTGQPDKRAPFEPMPPGVEFVPYGDIAALDAAVDENTAAVFLEPIMGEGGVVVPPEGYLAEARRSPRERGALLDARRSADRHRPHRLLLRAPGRRHRARRDDPRQGSRRRSADRCVHRDRARPPTSSSPGKHGTTFGGNPVCAAAALAVLRTIDERRPARPRQRRRQDPEHRHRVPRAPARRRTCGAPACCSVSS